MPGLINFSLSLLILILIAFGTMRKSRRLIMMAFFCMVVITLLGWYQYIFPTGLSALFITGTLATVLVICSFFYAVYSNETVWFDVQDKVQDK